ncbi:unnamed protein product [Microthlaspi erraticum]|uniref:KIB1-4 beta-propeller domain-containing protein n=1 Tax=Microthlaspi erraticum TaxID=1685480 RepID=A0A6D2LE92_9BRAS|nr:unnamed protein product [Microthlaspi erraticum]
MSRLLSKLSPLIHKKSVRSFSSSRTGPCASICSTVEPSPDGGNVGEVLLKDGSVVISDFLNPFASKSPPQTIHLPPFTCLPHCQTQVMCNVAMSSSPEPYDDKDWVVGIKFLGKQLSLCRPRRDLRWTNISVPFDSWEYSSLMFSKKDKRFYLPVPGSNYLCSWDLNFKKDSNPKFHELVLHDLPHMHRPDGNSLIPIPGRITGSSHLLANVSLSNGAYTEYKHTDGFIVPTAMVFREEDRKDGRINMRYAEDLGDNGIFISKAEDFCVATSSNRGYTRQDSLLPILAYSVFFYLARS